MQNNHNQSAIIHITSLEKIFSSTPLRKIGTEKMAVSFATCFGNSNIKCDNLSDVVDNDSGFVSHTQESNSGIMENVGENYECSNFSGFLSEDALLEKPTINVRTDAEDAGAVAEVQEAEEFSHLFFLSNSVVGNSMESEATNFSGLQDESGVSDVSDVLAPVESIVVEETTHISAVEDKISGVDAPTQLLSVVLAPSTPQNTYTNPVNANCSPDIFSDDDDCHETTDSLRKKAESDVVHEKYVLKKDRKLLKHVSEALNGVQPPTSLTMARFSVDEILAKIKENEHLFLDDSYCATIKGTSLLLTGQKDDCLNKPWPTILEGRYHGLHYNRSKLSEEIEQECLKYGLRYVGSETHSTCTVFETNLSSPSKRRTKVRWNAKSPGRRLSHLARRRITFTNPAVQLSSASSSAVCSRARQILVDARRLELLNRRKSPRKRTPRKSPRKTPRKSPRVKGRTPTSSASKKRLVLERLNSEEENSAPSTSASRVVSTKRALFQSPEKVMGSASFCGFTNKSTPKRALFLSPQKSSPSKFGTIFDRKRKRSESEPEQPSKFQRHSELEKPSIVRQSSISGCGHGVELSAHHKKKLQWAVYEALRSRNIGVSHPQFKAFASVLARVTRRFLPNLSGNAPRPEGGTSERMLRIARQHVIAVTKGKTVDEIVQEVRMNNVRPRKPMGYVSIEEAEKVDVWSARRNKENVLQDRSNTMHSTRSREETVKPKFSRGENNVDRIRKVIDFGDDPAR